MNDELIGEEWIFPKAHTRALSPSEYSDMLDVPSCESNIAK